MNTEKYTFSFPDDSKHTVDLAALGEDYTFETIQAKVSALLGETEKLNSKIPDDKIDLQPMIFQELDSLRNRVFDLIALQTKEKNTSKKEALESLIGDLLKKVALLKDTITVRFCHQELKKIKVHLDAIYKKTDTKQLPD